MQKKETIAILKLGRARIVSDCIQRICSLSPSFFSTNFPNNTVPNRHKIIYKPDLGSSKRRVTAQVNAAVAVDAHIDSLPPHTLLAFTDGSAKPNPGPAGALGPSSSIRR